MPIKNSRYPRIYIRSKNELAKRISGKGLSREEALWLINSVIKNFDNYWYDSEESKPEERKYVRSAVGTPLGRLLKLIDKRVLAPHDRLVPDFIFGGLSERNHIQATHFLLGRRRQRTLLALDIRRFFEQIKEERIFYFFYKKCSCSRNASRLLAFLSCVPRGPKAVGSEDRILARGFATSSRLALWCNLDLFLRLNWLVQKKLKNYDPRVAIFVDDIGIMASRISKELMHELSREIESFFNNFDKNQTLPLNNEKRKVLSYTDGIEHLGLRLGRNKVSLGSTVKSKRDNIYTKLKKSLPKFERAKLLSKKREYNIYVRQIAIANSK